MKAIKRSEFIILGVNYAALMGAYGVQQGAGIQGNPYAAYAGRSAGAQAAHQLPQQAASQAGGPQHGNMYSSYQNTLYDLHQTNLFWL